MITLYGAPASVFVRKPRILLQEKRIEFISDPINLYEYVNSEFQEASPLNKIPALKDDAYTLADSSAICAYIERKYPYPRFYPEDPQEYGKALWYEEYADTILFQAIAPCYYQTVLVPLYRHREPDKNAIHTAINDQLPSVANYLESQIMNKYFFVGNQFSIANVAIVSMFMNMHYSGFKLDSTAWPYLSQYLQRQFERESFISCRKDLDAELHKLKAVTFISS
jgi:glutathione S-transferase